VDHDNVQFDRVNVGSVVGQWLSAIADELPSAPILNVYARAYGGWWNGDTASDSRYRAAEFYQAVFPSVLRVAGRFVRLRFAFADYLIADQAGVRITHTVVSRASAQSVGIRSSYLPCPEIGCQLSAIRTWVRRRRACPKSGCPRRFEECFERREQKQVDTHLATDFLTIASGRFEARHVAVVSDDADLLPAVLNGAATMHSVATVTLLRFTARTTYLDEALVHLGVKIVTCSI
jgi:hypothetical protein